MDFPGFPGPRLGGGLAGLGWAGLGWAGLAARAGSGWPAQKLGCTECVTGGGVKLRFNKNARAAGNGVKKQVAGS